MLQLSPQIKELYIKSQNGFKYQQTENESQILKISFHQNNECDKCSQKCKLLKKENFYQYLANEKIVQHLKVFKKDHQLQFDSSNIGYCCSSLIEKADSCVFKEIFEKGSYQDFELCLDIAIKICESLKVIHDEQMAHNNIKSEKFLYFCKGNQIKINGLGFVCKYNEQSFDNFVWIFKNRKKKFLSEEIKKALNEINSLTGPNLLNLDFRKSDIFDLGFVFFELIYQVQFQDYFFHEKIYEYFMDDKNQSFTKQNDEKYVFFYPIIKNCLKKNFDERPKITELLKILKEKQNVKK